MCVLFEQFQFFDIFMNGILLVWFNGEARWNVFWLFNPQFMVDVILLELITQRTQIIATFCLSKVGE